MLPDLPSKRSSKVMVVEYTDTAWFRANNGVSPHLGVLLESTAVHHHLLLLLSCCSKEPIKLTSEREREREREIDEEKKIFI